MTSTARTCDADGVATAAVTYTLSSGKTLDFCQHHSNRHGPELVSQGADVDVLVTPDELVAAFSAEPVPTPATGYTAEGSI